MEKGRAITFFLSTSVDFSNVALFIGNEAHFCRMLCLD